MALNTREILMVLRARDQASRVISDVARVFPAELDPKIAETHQRMANLGLGIAGVGIVMGGVGLAGIGFLNGAIDSGKEFDRQIALVQTQVRGAGTTFETLADIAIDVGRRIPVPYEDLNKTFFDIFSSMDVNTAQAGSLLDAFAKASVAGQADIQDASRATMAVMNAYKLPVEDVNKVLDTQFKMVQIGVGTYGEFAGAIGRAVPASVSAGQSFESLAGMMAFLTRNGLSAEMAATSAARAMELFTKPDSVASLQKLGISLQNADGSMRQMDDVVTQLANNKGWASMDELARKKMFEEIFGTGTIQARRFFDLAIPNFNEFSTLTGEVRNGAGSMQGAYDIMFNQPASQSALLANNIAALKYEIWDVLRPVVIMMTEHALAWINRWNNLSDSTKRIIIIIGAVVSIMMVLAGIVLVIVGFFMTFSAVMAMSTLTFGMILTPIGWVILAIIALVAVGYLLYRNWDTVSKYAGIAWGYIKDAVEVVWNYMQQFAGWVARVAPMIWRAMIDAAQTAWDYMVSFGRWVADVAIRAWEIMGDVVSAVWNGIVASIEFAWDIIQTIFNALVTAWEAVVNFFQTNSFIQDVVGLIIQAFTELGLIAEEVVQTVQVWFGILTTFFQGWSNATLAVFRFLWPAVTALFSAWFDQVRNIVQTAVDVIVAIVSNLWPLLRPVVDTMVSSAVLAFDLMRSAIETIFNTVRVIIETVVGTIRDIMQNNWDRIGALVNNTWVFIRDVVSGFIDVISGIIKLFLNILQGDWSGAWDNIKQILSGAWQIMYTSVATTLTYIRLLIEMALSAIWSIFVNGWEMIVAVLKIAWDGMWDIVRITIGWIWDEVQAFPGRIWDILWGLKDILYDAGKAIMDGLWRGMKDIWDNVTDWLSNLDPRGWFNDINLKLGHAEVNLLPTGRAVFEGLHKGMMQGWDDTATWLQRIDPSQYVNIDPVVGYSNGAGGNLTISEGAVQIILQGNASEEHVQAIKDNVNETLQGMVVAIRQGRRN